MSAGGRGTRVLEREAVLDRRERAVAKRERAADEREAMADKRERATQEREAMADARERSADEREAMADARERSTDERERRLNGLEKRLLSRAHAKGLPTATERVLEAIEQGRALLEASAASLDRSESALLRSQERDHREQQEINRQVAAGERAEAKAHAGDDPPVSATPRLAALAERVKLLREEVAENATKLAYAEDEVARHHEQMAERNPARDTEYRKTAQDVRASAARVRAFARHFTAPPPR